MSAGLQLRSRMQSLISAAPHESEDETVPAVRTIIECCVESFLTQRGATRWT